MQTVTKKKQVFNTHQRKKYNIITYIHSYNITEFYYVNNCKSVSHFNKYVISFEE